MRTTTERTARHLAAVVCLGVLPACRAPTAPPDTFDVTVDAPPQKGKPSPVPPGSVLTPWKVWINQETPRQKKSPEWRLYDAKVGTPLDLAADGAFRCTLGPARVVGRTNERGAIQSWTASRKVRCSSDGFRTSVEALVRAQYAPDGALTNIDPPAAMYLNDLVSSQPRLTAVVLKKDGTPAPLVAD